MFTILGGDGKEYGPVTAEQIRAWIQGGRANLETQAKAAGTEEWRRLGDFAEFSGAPLPPLTSAASYGAPVIATPMSGMQPAQFAADSLLAGHGARIGAAFINALLYLFSLLPGGMIMGVQLMKKYPDMAQGRIPQAGDIDPAFIIQAALWIYAGLGVAMILQAILISVRGQSLGKLIVGVRVVQLDGRPAGFLRGALLRYLIPSGVFIVLLNVPFVGFLLAAMYLIADLCFMFRADRRCLHDLVAGTKVVRK